MDWWTDNGTENVRQDIFVELVFAQHAHGKYLCILILTWNKLTVVDKIVYATYKIHVLLYWAPAPLSRMHMGKCIHYIMYTTTVNKTQSSTSTIQPAAIRSAIR